MKKDNDNIIEPENENDFVIINNEYKVKYKGDLGYGSFGHIYKCHNIKTNKEFACKSEPNDALVPQIQHEYKIYKTLEGGVGIPRVYAFKTINSYTIMVMDLLGPNLGDVLEDTIAKKFTLKTSLLILDQLLSRLNFIHDKGIIHRDIKPENFLVSNYVNEGVIYLIDFGLSKKYIDSKTREHIPLKKERPIVGTIKYISPNVHNGIEQSRRDDLISLLYSFLFLYQGVLPWDEIRCKNNEEKIQKIYSYKSQYTPELLSQELPEELQAIFQHVFKLGYNDRPNYSYMQIAIKKLMSKLKLEEDGVFDWMQIELLEQPIPMILEIKRKKKLKQMEERKKEEEEKKKKLEEEQKKHKEDKEKNQTQKRITSQEKIKHLKGSSFGSNKGEPKNLSSKNIVKLSFKKK